MGGDPNHLLTGMILQVHAPFSGYIRKVHSGNSHHDTLQKQSSVDGRTPFQKTIWDVSNPCK